MAQRTAAVYREVGSARISLSPPRRVVRRNATATSGLGGLLARLTGQVMRLERTRPRR